MHKITDRMTAEDLAIYDHMSLVGRLMIHRDRRDARIMHAHSISGIYQLLTPVERIVHQIQAERYEPGHEKSGHWFDTNTNGFSDGLPALLKRQAE